MRTKLIAGVLTASVVLAGAGTAAAATGGRQASSKSGTEKYWISGFSLKTGNPTEFVGTGFFTDAGKLVGTGGDKAELSKGTFVANSSKIKFGLTVNSHTCFATETLKGSVSLGHGTGAYKGISGSMSIGGKIYLVFPKLPSGKCNESNSAVPLGIAGVASGSGTVTIAG